MATIPSLALIPSGYKASKVYSVLPTDGTGDFTFTRSGNATRVNSDGLIELVSTNVPRLNYPLIDGVVSGCPSLLLEPSRINLALYSEQFDNPYWSNTRITINPNSTSTLDPSGYNNSYLIVQDASDTNGGAFFRIFNFSAVIHTFSVFAKMDEVRYINLAETAAVGTIRRTWFDIQSGVVGTTNAGHTAKIESYGNGWYRCSITFTATAGNFSILTYLSDADNSTIAAVSKGSYLYGLQLEAGSYPTSYIPSLIGSQTTRSAETCNNAGDVNTFNDSEGVLFAEISYPITPVASGNKRIAISDTTSINRVLFAEIGNTGFSTLITSSGSNSAYITADVNNLLSLKTAVKYKQNNFALWINGFEVGTDTSGNTPIGLSELAFDGGDGTNNFYGNTKQIQYFNTALNDTDLETLTSWDSFSDMAIGQLYTIE
jgi:hypothetical protein